MDSIFSTIDKLFEMITGQTPLWIYLFVLVSMTFENFFPPYPGDTVVFLCAVYASGGGASWSIVYLLSVIGTLISVMSLYYLGNRQGRAVFARNKFKWVNQDRLTRIERWFRRWGEKVLLVSRFVVGIRAALALFAGVGDVRPWKMLIYSLISAAAWNFLIAYTGLWLRRDSDVFERALGAYSTIVYLILGLILLFLVGRSLKRRWKKTSR
jgi:membrane protein DedA with SNARE-associated domain